MWHFRGSIFEFPPHTDVRARMGRDGTRGPSPISKGGG